MRSAVCHIARPYTSIRILYNTMRCFSILPRLLPTKNIVLYFTKTKIRCKIVLNTIRAVGIHRLETIETSQVPFIKKEFIEIWNNKRDGIEKCYINQNALTYREQLMLEQREIDKQNLLEMEGYIEE